MPELEDDLKLQNWLSILTYDVSKYAKKGGRVRIEWTPAGLVLYLDGVTPQSDGLNARFLRMPAATPAPAEEPAS